MMNRCDVDQPRYFFVNGCPSVWGDCALFSNRVVVRLAK